MSRAALTVAEVFRRYGDAFRAQAGAALSTAQRRVMTAIEQCRTAALGGHVEQCDHCGHRRVWYNSCRNRHCPTCQSLARAAWLERRRADLLPTEYFHVVFTVPPAVAEIAGLLFMAGMRRSEVSALRWADVADAADGDGVLVTVRRSKTNQEGETRDVRFVKGGVARAIRTLRAAASPAPTDRVVPLSPKMVGLRFQAAARAAGVEHVTAHSGRVGLASELTSRGASTTDVILAGNWKTSRMVAHYSAGATAERGAVARYL